MPLSLRRTGPTAPAEAFVVSDGFTAGDALSEELDNEFGEGRWRMVRGAEAEKVFSADDETGVVIVAIDSDAPEQVDAASDVVRMAHKAGLLVLLVVGDLSPRVMHRLMREGVTEFAPFPEPRTALQEAIGRIRVKRADMLRSEAVAESRTSEPKRLGRIIGVYGVAGGVGASTFATNLAWELAIETRKQGMKIALLDFNFQYGSVATYLDVPRREAVYELISEASSLDQTGFDQALSSYQGRLSVLTAPRDALPLDIVAPGEIGAILNLAREAFDFVVVDMPQALMNWSEQVYTAAESFYALMEIDMRSAQNMFRFLRALRAEEMPLDKMVFVLNRSPGLTDLTGKTRVKRVAESLGIEFSHLLADGGKQVTNACDQGVPLAEAAKSNPVRKEIMRIAQSLAKDTAKAKSAKA